MGIKKGHLVWGRDVPKTTMGAQGMHLRHKAQANFRKVNKFFKPTERKKASSSAISAGPSTSLNSHRS